MALKPGPWTRDPLYEDMLYTEAIALRAGDNITPNANHVCVIVDRLIALSQRTDRLAVLTEQLLQATRCKNFALRRRRRWNVRSPEARASKHQKDHTMADNLQAVQQIVNLFVDAFNDTAHAFGDGKGATSITDFANLLPDVMGLVANVGDLSAELKNIEESDLDSILATVEQRLQIPNQKAELIVQAILVAIGKISDAAVGAGSKVEKAFIKHAG